MPSHVGIANTVHGDARASVLAVAPQIGGVLQCVARRIELCHEGIIAACVDRLNLIGTHRGGKVC